MGGTDLLDETVSRYRINIRRKKWWWSIFTWLLDVVVVNAWSLCRRSQSTSIPQLAFRREIWCIWLNMAYPQVELVDKEYPDQVYDGQDHLLVPTVGNKRRRCAGEGCCSSIRAMCKKCDVCLACNFIFHTKWNFLEHFCTYIWLVLPYGNISFY